MTVREYIRKNWNVPNALTLLRLFLVPVYIAFFVRGRKYWALGCFLLASLTDLLDGRIARKYNLITNFGKLMDPVADKVMVLTAMISMAVGNPEIPAVIPWPAVMVIMVKELVMISGGLFLLNKQVVVFSHFIGKAAQCAFVVGLVSVYFHDSFVQLCAGWPMPLDLMFIWISVALALCALVFYVKDTYRIIKENNLL